MATAIINAIRTVSGNQPAYRRIGEKAGNTFKSGTPVMIDAGTGYIKAWDGATLTNGIAGVTPEFGANLAVNAVAQQVTQGGVPNQSAAVNLQRPYFNNGAIGFYVANQDSVFYGQVGPAQTTAATDVGVSYGMTIDSDGHWFVDKTKTSGNAVVKVVNLDPSDTVRGVHFVFLVGAEQLTA